MPTRHRHAHTTDLRRTVNCLPVHTREAMLEGVRSNDIIVGAYVDRDGGVCPMLAAHRCGGRTDFLSFARAWDRFTGARGRARRATQRELNVLISHLEGSLLDEHGTDLSAAIAEHRTLAGERRERRARPARRRRNTGERDRAQELGQREGWSWMRPFRRLDEYERALERLQRDELQRDEHAVPVLPGGGEDARPQEHELV